MIIQSISLLDQMDKDLNLFSMRLKEWYSWHFPELSKIVSDNLMFAKLVLAIRNKTDLKDAVRWISIFRFIFRIWSVFEMLHSMKASPSRL